MLAAGAVSAWVEPVTWRLLAAFTGVMPDKGSYVGDVGLIVFLRGCSLDLLVVKSIYACRLVVEPWAWLTDPLHNVRWINQIFLAGESRTATRSSSGLFRVSPI